MVGEYLQNTKQLKWNQLTLSVVAHLMSDGKAIYISYQFIKSEEKNDAGTYINNPRRSARNKSTLINRITSRATICLAEATAISSYRRQLLIPSPQKMVKA